MHIHFINKHFEYANKIDFLCGGLATMANVGGFFKNVMSEMRKVSWPKTKRTYKIYCCSAYLQLL